MEKESVLHVGGSVEKALKGEYKIDVHAVLREAWKQTVASRLSINIGFLFIAVIVMTVVSVVAEPIGGVDNLPEFIKENQQEMFIFQLALVAFIAPFAVGLDMMGVFHSVGLKTQPKLVFAFLKRAGWIITGELICQMLLNLGHILILPAIYLLVALSLTLPLIVEKRMTPIEAVMTGIKASRFKWFQLFAVYAALLSIAFGILFISLMLAQTIAPVFGISFLLFAVTYLIPWFYNAKGILYREMYGLELQASSQNSELSDDTFSA